MRVAFVGYSQAHLRLCLLGWGQAPDIHSNGPLQNHGRPGGQAPGPAPGLTYYETADDLSSLPVNGLITPALTHHRIKPSKGHAL